MKRFTFLAIVLCVLAGSASALPSYTGLRGLNRVVDARTIDAGEWAAGLFTFLGFSADTRTAQLTGGPADVTDTEYSGTAYLTAGFGVSQSVELAARISYLMNQLKRDDVEDRLNITGDWEGDDGFSEASFYLKYSLNPDSDNYWFGLMPWAGLAIYDGGDNNFVYNQDGWDGIWELDQPMFQMRRPMINSGNVSFGADLLATVDLKPVLVHVNMGYHYFKQHFEYTDTRYNAAHQIVASEDVDMEVEDPVFRLATGFEYPMDDVILFTEVEWRHFMKRDFEDGDGEDFDDCIQIAPGVRFTYESGFAFDVTGSFALSSFDPEYNDLGHRYYQQGATLSEGSRADYAPFPGGYAPKWGIGLNIMYSSDLRVRPAHMSGSVYDSDTGEPVAASISFPNTEAEAAASNAETGQYAAQLDQGTYNVVVEANGYITQTEVLEASAGEEITRDYALQAIEGIVTGTVTDAGTEAPLAASVSVAGTTVSTESDGTYEIEVAQGDRTITASASGYASVSQPVAVVAGETRVVDFQLNMTLDFDNVYFDFDSHGLRPDAKAVLSQVAQVLLDNPGISIRIIGYTDSDGDAAYNQDLAERRAEAVRNYLISKGASEQALSTVSYGEENPAVPNTTSENKALNRRAEFIILGRNID